MTSDDLLLAGAAIDNLPKSAFTYDDTFAKQMNNVVRTALTPPTTSSQSGYKSSLESAFSAALKEHENFGKTQDQSTKKVDKLVSQEGPKLQVLAGSSKSMLGSLADELTGAFRGMTDAKSWFQGTIQQDKNKL